ncbi:hypothetical protein Poli38472_004243 [Pythium oligandrum]|uniref:WRKY19-like zinc finger domain-containing protein n=1 Tax=Pythium oligandrum TaxID=41045 RepID=A0A8K1FQC8_PYTOL|nr:hypothetical protein Poli38472_004243 [Pythium oligandrum]|eukprot:TMW66478.1 hypothetical protein Poli38472_004243 [Pythium oligandrum]
MEWIRAGFSAPRAQQQPLDADTPKFVLVDAKNRVRELMAPPTQSSALSQPQSMTHSQPVPMHMTHHHNYHHHHHHHHAYQQDEEERRRDDDAVDMDEDAQLEQQLQYQREEMRFRQPLPRITPPSHPFQSQSSQSSQQRPATFNHAFSYTESSSAQQFMSHPMKTPSTMPPVSPFAGMALSAPTKSTLSKPPVNPFGATFNSSIESSPRLPSLNAYRAGSPRHMKMGIAGRPPTLSLRSSSESTMSGMSSSSPSPHGVSSSPLPSLSSSLPSPHHTLGAGPYSQSLPGVSYLHDRLARQQSLDGSESMTNISSDDDDREPALLMMRLSSSVPTSSSMSAMDASPMNGQRSGRVCRYADCNNIARSRGLCRTHGGGKRCSHPGCNKSAQANRKCIAHGGGTPCSFEDCEKTAQSRGLCKAHGGGARCKHPNCPKSSQSKGLCRGHGGGIKCKEDGCEKWVQKNGYCIKHGRERAMTQ